MRRFCLRYLFVIFTSCLVVTSSYVLFDLLDIDGSLFKAQVFVTGFEAVMPACSGDIKPLVPASSMPERTSSHGPVFTGARLIISSPRPFLPSISRSLTIYVRKASRVESSSLARGSDPASRSV